MYEGIPNVNTSVHKLIDNNEFDKALQIINTVVSETKLVTGPEDLVKDLRRNLTLRVLDDFLLVSEIPFFMRKFTL